MNNLRPLIIAVILSFIATAVIAVNQNTGNNVCDISKKTKFNGTQNPNGECVTTVLGEIPSKGQMTSTVILFPTEKDVLTENTPFTVKTKTNNLATGFFDDPAKQYYVFPQTLDNNGVIQGHSHVTIQQIKNANEPLDAQIFAFFKGLNDKAVNGNELDVLVDKGLPAGDYRVCTMVASFAHQPTLMPIAQRGSQDDCRRFTVKAGNGGKGNGGNNGGNGGKGNGGNGGKGNGGNGGKGNGGNGGKGNGGNGGKGNGENAGNAGNGGNGGKGNGGNKRRSFRRF